MFVVGAAMFAMWYFESLYMQEVLGYSPLKAGLAFLPQPLCITLGAFVCSRMVARVGAKPLLIVGPTFSVFGLLYLSHVSATGGYYPYILFGGAMAALGVGLSFAPAAVAATSGVAMHEAGLASGIINASRQLGGALGLAVLSTIASGLSVRVLTQHGTSPSVLSGGSGGPATQIVRSALTQGFGRAFFVGGLIMILAVLAALIIPYSKPVQNEAVAVASPSAKPAGMPAAEPAGMPAAETMQAD